MFTGNLWQTKANGLETKSLTSTVIYYSTMFMIIICTLFMKSVQLYSNTFATSARLITFGSSWSNITDIIDTHVSVIKMIECWYVT